MDRLPASLHWIALTLTLLLAAPPALSAPLSYPVVWDDVALDPEQGKDLTANCVCNLHPFVCDRDCCCDPDCPQAVSDATRRAGNCRPEGPPEQTLDFCVPDGFVRKVNLPTSFDFFELRKQAADDNFFGQLLCITKSSSPKLSDDFPDPPAGDVDGNPARVPCPRAAMTPSIPESYRVHTPLFIARNGVRQQLALPSPLFSAVCVDQTLGFLDNIPKKAEDVFRSCIRPIPDATTLQRMCEAGGVLSPQLYTDFLFEERPGHPADRPPFLPEVLISNDGTTTRVDAANVASTFANGVCSNAVQHINFTVFYDLADATSSVEATITRISVALTLTDVDARAGAHRQLTRVSFMDSEQQSQVLQPFSGNPGYQKGLPLLAGALVEDPDPESDKMAIQRSVRGIIAPQGRESDGICSPDAQGGTVRFGANATFSCAVELTRAELEAFCNSQDPQRYVERALGEVYTVLVAQAARVGVWGNSDPNNVNEWLRVVVSNFPFNPMNFRADPGRCSNVVVGYDLQILTGVAFSANNLQHKVLYAHLCFRTATWTFPDTKASTDRHRFFLTSTATFVPKEQERRTDIRKPSPPLRTTVPEDIFYPFVTSTAQRQAGVPPLVAAVCACAAVLLALQMLCL